LSTDSEIAFGDVSLDGVHGFRDIAPVGVGVDEDTGAAAAAKEVVNGGVERLAFDVPQGNINGSDRGHGYGTATPISSPVKVLPDVFDLRRIAPDDAGQDVFFKIRCNGEFAAIESRVAEAVDPFVRLDFERDKVAIGRGDDESCCGDLHVSGHSSWS